MSLERALVAAQGYIELEMPDEALQELDSLPHQDQRREEAVQMRLFITMRARRWPDALALCERIRASTPDSPTGYIHGAFCLHELGRTREARQLLMEGPPSLNDEATYHYNLGCYNAVLGNLEEATRHLEVSFEMDEKFRHVAKHDPDLKSVHDLLKP